MKVFFDTNVLVAAVIEQHESHERAHPLLERVQAGKDEGWLSAHGLAEIYAVLTRLPAPYRHTPEQALLGIEENYIKHFKLAGLNGSDYVSVVREAALRGIHGGTVYDAVLLRSAELARVERIYTLNLKHFQAVATGHTATLLRAP